MKRSALLLGGPADGRIVQTDRSVVQTFAEPAATWSDEALKVPAPVTYTAQTFAFGLLRLEVMVVEGMSLTDAATRLGEHILNDLGREILTRRP